MSDLSEMLCIYSRRPVDWKFQFTGPSPSCDFLLLDLLSSWKSVARVWELDEVPFRAPTQALSDPRVVSVFVRCLLQASLVDTRTGLSPYLARAVAQIPDVLSVSGLQGWVDRFARQTGYALQVGRVIRVDPDLEWEQHIDDFDLVGYYRISPAFPWPDLTAFRQTDSQLWNWSAGVRWMMVESAIAYREADDGVERFYDRYNSQLRWWESYLNGCFDELTDLQKLASLLDTESDCWTSFTFARIQPLTSVRNNSFG